MDGVDADDPAPHALRAPSNEVVGRATELDAIADEWSRASAGHFRCVLLTGEPGMGKTRLASEFVERLRLQAVVLRARAHPLSATASFGVWSEAVEDHLRGLSAEEIRAMVGSALDDLAALSHRVVAVRGGAPAWEVPRFRLLEALGAVIAQIAESRPVIVLLDDFHLADDSSWDALHYLASSVRTSRVLVIGTARRGELAERPLPARVALDLERDGTLRHFRLGPLARDAVATLACHVLGEVAEEDLVGWLMERTQGNPLFVRWVLESLDPTDRHTPPRRRGTVVPSRLKTDMRGRLELLDEPDRNVAHILAVAGGRVALRELGQMAERSIDDLDLALERLVRRGLVHEEETGSGFVYEIGNPLIQEAIYDGLSGPRRLVLHRQVGRVLLDAGRLGDAVLHFARSAGEDDPEAVEVLCRALTQAESREAYREALKILGAVGELLPPRDPRWKAVAGSLSHRPAWVVDHRADAEALAGIRALTRMDECLDEGDDVITRAVVKSRLAASLGWGTGQLHDAEAVAQAAIGLYERGGAHRQALDVAFELAYLEGLKGDVVAMEQAASAVLERAEALQDHAVAIRARGLRGDSLLYQGRFDEAEACLRATVAKASELDSPYRRTRSQLSLAWTLGWSGALQSSLDTFASAKAGPTWRETNLLEAEAHVRWLAGDFSGALRCAEEGFALDPGGPSLRRGLGICVAAMAALETGSVHEARHFVDLARRRYGSSTWFYLSEFYRQAEALVIWHDGNAAAAVSLFRTASTNLLRMGARVFAAPIFVNLAQAAIECGEQRVAHEAADLLEELSSASNRDLYTALARIGAAWSHYGAGAMTRSVSAAGEAVELLEGSGYECWRGRALEIAGRAMLAADEKRGRHLIGQAVDVWRELGAAWRADRALIPIKRPGTDHPPGATTAPSMLTRREAEVARLAAQRLTAQEIGELLFISPRTVESHLARAYTKLGLRSRRELARWAEGLL